MTDINGFGYGCGHDWKRGETIYRVTWYKCRVCGQAFGHNYPQVPNIFEAMARSGRVSDLCIAPSDDEAVSQERVTC